MEGPGGRDDDEIDNYENDRNDEEGDEQQYPRDLVAPSAGQAREVWHKDRGSPKPSVAYPCQGTAKS